MEKILREIQLMLLRTIIVALVAGAPGIGLYYLFSWLGWTVGASALITILVCGLIGYMFAKIIVSRIAES